MLAKGPLKPPSKPMTSSSSSQSSTARGELSFSVEPQRRKVTQFNPLLTPSPLLDPKELERKRKAMSK